MTYVADDTFHPPFYLTHPALQTVLASIKLRRWGTNPMLKAAQHYLIDAGDGIRLPGFYSPIKDKPSKGLCILLHGWEGSSDSTYVLSCGRYLYANGYAVFRLNYRDHGNSHHLNQGLFYATRLEEVFQAVRQAACFSNNAPVFLVGFSLGGNFALRIAKCVRHNSITSLKQIISISPVLDPDKATDRIDSNPFLLAYFMKKWKKSLAYKQCLFPGHYDFSDVLHKKNIRDMTNLLLSRYSEYPDTKTYFKSYGVYGPDIADIQVPTTIITAADDPVIPIEDFHNLKTSLCTDLVIHKRGGHNGFVDSVCGPAWYDRFMLNKFSCPHASNKA